MDLGSKCWLEKLPRLATGELMSPLSDQQLGSSTEMKVDLEVSTNGITAGNTENERQTAPISDDISDDLALGASATP